MITWAICWLLVNSNGELVHHILNKSIVKVGFEGNIDDFLDIITKKVENFEENMLFLLN